MFEKECLTGIEKSNGDKIERMGDGFKEIGLD
jgi:hypothetical protein